MKPSSITLYLTQSMFYSPISDSLVIPPYIPPHTVINLMKHFVQHGNGMALDLISGRLHDMKRHNYYVTAKCSTNKADTVILKEKIRDHITK